MIDTKSKAQGSPVDSTYYYCSCSPMKEVRDFPDFIANWSTGKQPSLLGCQPVSWRSKPGVDFECKVSILVIQITFSLP